MDAAQHCAAVSRSGRARADAVLADLNERGGVNLVDNITKVQTIRPANSYDVTKFAEQPIGNRLLHCDYPIGINRLSAAIWTSDAAGQHYGNR
jgi:hypothetical protein